MCWVPGTSDSGMNETGFISTATGNSQPSRKKLCTKCKNVCTKGRKQAEQKTLNLTLYIRNYNSLNLHLYLRVLGMLQTAYAYYYLGHYC